MNNKTYTESQRKRIVALHLEKRRTMKSLAKEFGVSVSTISRWAIRYKNIDYFMNSKRING